MSITPIAHREVAPAVAVLVGQPFQRGMRVGDMEMFEFGVPKPWTDRKGRARIQEEFDPSSGLRTLRDELLDAYHAERTDPPRIGTAIRAYPTGDLTIVLDDESRLAIRPSDTTVEYWRLLRPDGSQVDVDHDGATLAAPDASAG